ncbi:hypothetical protein [Deinococcus fonticola]|uniref:hypothetical protein n=1 Tax=Deinococcus fonticola TaxID=2528713 RepID=UPI0010757046|nr:hypothetical protein [Deinococcus fonticola]
MQKTPKIHLPILSARTWQEYLDANDGDAERAGKAARADVADREKQNASVRRFHRVYAKIITDLGLELDPNDEDAAADAAKAAIAKLKSDAGSSDTVSKQLAKAQEALKKLGIDPEKPEDGVKAAEAKFARAATADTLERENAFGKAAAALKFDPGKLAKVLRDEQGVPELRKVKSKNDKGEDVEQDVWGIPARDEKGTETGFTPLSDHPDVKGFEAALRITGEPVTADANASQPVIVPSKASATPANVTKVEGINIPSPVF